MDKLKMHTPNLADENYQKLAELFPNAVTETTNENGEVVRAIDADVLRQEISSEVVEGNQERYQFNWPDKRKSVMLANQPIAKTLRLDRVKSVGRDGTPGEIDSENIYIEGDNLDALKLLQETYLGKVKMIYIDPPYNTGNDRIFKDNFYIDSKEFTKSSNQIDEENNRLFLNTNSNGRFHTNWLNMLYPRLKIARDLLSEDGVIFISIDDGEVDNLRLVCNEIFGASNFIGQAIRASSANQNTSKYMSIMHDYTLIYCKNKSINNGNWKVLKNYAEEFETRAKKLLKNGLELETIQAELRALTKYPRFFDFDHYTMCDEGGVFQLVSMGGVSKGNTSTQIYHPITGKPCTMPQNGWRYSENTLQDIIAKNEVYFGKDDNYIPRRKLYLKDYLFQSPKGISFYDTQNDVNFLKQNKIPFDFPKPKEYIQYLTNMIGIENNDIILDFFSGSATTAHAIMQLNAESNGNRKFIMVQIPEIIDEKNKARKAGFKTICDIGEKRIKVAGTKIREETGADIDYGFRVFKVDSSNMKDVYYNPSEVSQEQISVFTDNIKEDRTPEDLLIQVMLDLGIPLSSKIDEIEVNGKKVFSLDDGFLLACFDENITDETITQIAKMEPYYAVFRDSSIKDDSVMVNYDQIFEAYSPKTQRKVL